MSAMIHMIRILLVAGVDYNVLHFHAVDSVTALSDTVSCRNFRMPVSLFGWGSSDNGNAETQPLTSTDEGNVGERSPIAPPGVITRIGTQLHSYFLCWDVEVMDVVMTLLCASLPLDIC